MGKLNGKTEFELDIDGLKVMSVGRRLDENMDKSGKSGKIKV